MPTSDFHETMKVVEEIIGKLERGEHGNRAAGRAIAEEMLDELAPGEDDEMSFKHRLRLKEARHRLGKLPHG